MSENATDTATQHEPTFDDVAALRRWIDRIGGTIDAARSTGIAHRTMERIYAGKFDCKRRIARELATIAGEPEAVT